MATVWTAVNLGTERRVAIKILAERFWGNASVAERFFREARAASAIRHRGIVDVLDVERTEDGVPFLVMEYVEGETLAQRIEREKPLPIGEAKQIWAALAAAVGAAHAKGIVHRDIKPDNVVLGKDPDGLPRITLLDFGIAQVVAEATEDTSSRGVVGTPHYMSPEQARDDTTVDARADVYALGVVMYEMIVGAVPFDAPSSAELLERILRDDAPPPSQRRAGLPTDLERLIMRCLSKSRDERPRDANTLRSELDSVANAEESWGDFATLRDKPRTTPLPVVREPLKPKAIPLQAEQDAMAVDERLPAVELDYGDVPSNPRAQVEDKPHGGEPPRASPVAASAPDPSPSNALQTVPRAVWLGSALLVVIVVLILGIRLIVRPGAGPELQVTPTQGVGPETTSTAGTSDGVAEITLTGLPPNSSIHIDGFAMTSMPVRMRTHVSHTIDIEAPGYEPRRIVLTPTGSQTIAARMRRDTVP